MSEEDNNQGSVAEHPNDKDDGEYDRDDVGLRTVLVRSIGHLRRVDWKRSDIICL